MVTINIDSNINNNLLIIGAGEGGCRIAETFLNNGFNNVLAINTAKSDLDGLTALTDDNKYLIPVTNGEGAGKDPSVVRTSIDSYYNDVKTFIQSKIKDQDAALICIGGGGGSGSGLGIVLCEMCSELNLNVGIIYTLPIKNESTLVFVNALQSLNEIYENVKNAAISPFILVDNNELYKRFSPSVANFWKPLNTEIVKVVKKFNEYASYPSHYISALDRKDLKRLLSIGGSCAIGSVEISSVDNQETIIEKINNSFFMSGFDLTTCKSAGLIIVGTEETLNTPESTKFVNTIFDKISSLCSGSFFRGVYSEKDVKFLKIYLIFNGLTLPEEKITDMMKEINEGYGKIKSQENRIDGVFFDLDKRVSNIFSGNDVSSQKKIVRNTSTNTNQNQVARKPITIPGVQRRER